MTEPDSVIAPMATPSPISTRLARRMPPSAPTMPKPLGSRKAAAATSTAARPTSEWKAATSCGIAVMAMRRATVRPINPPMTMATRISVMLANRCTTSVVTIAISMPAMPRRLPRREVAGEDSPRSARMNRPPATR